MAMVHAISHQPSRAITAPSGTRYSLELQFQSVEAGASFAEFSFGGEALVLAQIVSRVADQRIDIAGGRGSAGCRRSRRRRLRRRLTGTWPGRVRSGIAAGDAPRPAERRRGVAE